ncbi:phage adaptor protein [Halomonas sp. IOP_31]|uniref:phage adaptor protein n=1 Tax=Halomonas sp. IOP_31 TaxID=2876584 RepID=UPI001E34C87C|nr:hypothetical protein [Halomonas sp. IOP_31]MCD6006908.1 hypothetical protein [Halomonas sp. IOP_31]
MTFLELCQRLRQEVGAAGTGPATVTGQNGEMQRLIGWIQQAWREIQTEQQEWRFAWAEGEVELSAGFRDYDLPDDFDHWVEDTLRIGDRPVRALDYPDFRRLHREPANEQAIGSVCVTPDNKLRLSSLPAAEVTLSFEYFRTPQELTDNGDVPRMPPRYHLLIVYRAMMQYGLYENAPEVVQQGNSNASRLMGDMMMSELPPMTFAGALA